MNKSSGDKQPSHFFKKLINSRWISFLGSVGSLIALVPLIASWFQPEYRELFRWVGIGILFVVAIVSSIALIVGWGKAKKYLNDLSSSHEQVLENHEQVLENIVSHLEKLSQDINEYTGEIVTGTLQSDNDLKQRMRHVCDCVVQLVEPVLSSAGNLCACIKWIDTDSLMNCANKEAWKVSTLARSYSTDRERERHDSQSVLINKNTDFKAIVIEGKPRFAVANLQKFDDEGRKKTPPEPYENTTKEYWKFYKSTIVHPICIDTKLVHPEIRRAYGKNAPTEGKHVIGFLCLDSLSTFDTPNATTRAFTATTRAMGAYAEILYNLLESYIVIQMSDSEK